MDQKRLRVCLMNDSFPPVIDGVANATKNYAQVIQDELGEAIVATPQYPDVEDHYAFPVVRYRSVDTTRLIGYRAGYPFSARTLASLSDFRPDIIHSHCPVMSNTLGRLLRERVDVPLVFTYHTKFDVDISHAVENKLIRAAAIRMLVSSIESSDEVWVVSRGAGENLRSLGYQGDWRVMANGVDFPRGPVPRDKSGALRAQLGIPAGTPVFLFVGRMMWYKGVRIILDALAMARREQYDCRMVFVGDGAEREEMQETAEQLGIGDRCLFPGAVRDRELLRTYFSMADLFLFPSSYDTNGIVVREAAACGLGSILIRGSCAAEDITDGQNGILIEENAQSLWAALKRLSLEQMHAVGEHALNEIYISWEDSVRRAYDRYQVVIDQYRQGHTTRHFEWSDDFLSFMCYICRSIAYARTVRDRGMRRLGLRRDRPEE